MALILIAHISRTSGLQRVQRLSAQVAPPSLSELLTPPMPKMDAADPHERGAIEQRDRLASELARQMIAEAQARRPDGGRKPPE